MSVDSIASVAGLGAGIGLDVLDPSQAAAAASANMATPTQSADFTQLVSRGLDEVNTQLMATQTDLQKLAAGDVQNLHQVMINMEEARMSFQLMIQVRNRALETYQDLMKMSV